MIYLDDGDVRLYHGDALETVRAMPDESVDCVVTSPPYWGLRDYGTGEWDGGDPDCDHVASTTGIHRNHSGDIRRKPQHDEEQAYSTIAYQYRDVCGKCGARRVDRQMGLEPTPDLFVQGMVELFREIRRVLAPHGTCWVNLGDSYNANTGRGFDTNQDGEINGKKSGAALSSRIPWGKPKDLVGIPWLVAFALQADGWWLRSDIIWAKPNPMPESVTDRPTKAHEYVFLLTKQPRYFFDTEAVREPHQHDGRTVTTVQGQNGSIQHRDGERWPNAGRNVRSVWQIATQPYPEAHFATYPEELARRCILAGCPTRVCRVCGKPSERIVEHGDDPNYIPNKEREAHGMTQPGNAQVKHGSFGAGRPREVVGWSDCGHNNWRPGVTLDPFIGSGTTAKVARDHQRHAIGIDLNREYLELAARRLQQLSLLT